MNNQQSVYELFNLQNGAWVKAAYVSKEKYIVVDRVIWPGQSDIPVVDGISCPKGSSFSQQFSTCIPRLGIVIEMDNAVGGPPPLHEQQYLAASMLVIHHINTKNGTLLPFLASNTVKPVHPVFINNGQFTDETVRFTMSDVLASQGILAVAGPISSDASNALSPLMTAVEVM